MNLSWNFLVIEGNNRNTVEVAVRFFQQDVLAKKPVVSDSSAIITEIIMIITIIIVTDF